MSVIFASSTCDLNLKTLKKVSVDVISLPVILNDKKCLYNADKFGFDEYYATPNFQVDEVKYKKLLEQKFNEALNTGQDVLFLTPNAKYDVSYKYVKDIIKQVAPSYPNQKIEMVNCGNYSLGYGLIVYEAGILNMRGESITEVTKFVNKIKHGIKTYIIPSTNDYIAKKLTIVGGTIGVRPVLEVSNNELKVIDNVRGKKRVVNYLTNLAKRNSHDLPLAIMCGKNTDEVVSIETEVLSDGEDRQIFKSMLNPLMLEKFGDKTIAISFYKKSK